MRDLHKAALERAIFLEFAQRWRADIDLASVASGNPNAREPDILAKSRERVDGLSGVAQVPVRDGMQGAARRK